MRKSFDTFVYMIINGLFGYFVFVLPTLGIYYALDWFGIPHFYNIILSFITSLLLISLYVSICNLIIQLKANDTSMNQVLSEEDIQRRFKDIVDRYSDHREELDRLRKEHREEVQSKQDHQDQQEQQ